MPVLSYSYETSNSTEAQIERTVAFPLQNGNANAPQCYVTSTMPLLLIHGNKNHTMIYGSIHLLKSYSYSANSCTFVTRASIGDISNSQHMFCSMWHANEQNCIAKHAWRFLHALSLKPQTHIPYQIEICPRDFTRVHQLFYWLPTYFIHDINCWGCVNVQWRPKVIWRRDEQTQRWPYQKLRTLQKITKIYWIPLYFVQGFYRGQTIKLLHP